MPGGLYWPFWQGTRSEYLAHYILSALGVAVKVPHEEDIGADFYCSLADFDGLRMTFRSPFIIQIKSVSEKEVRYGGPDDKDPTTEFRISKGTCSRLRSNNNIVLVFERCGTKSRSSKTNVSIFYAKLNNL